MVQTLLEFLLKHYQLILKTWVNWLGDSLLKQTIIALIVLVISFFTFDYFFNSELERLRKSSDNHSEMFSKITSKNELMIAKRWLNACIELENTTTNKDNKSKYCKQASNLFKEQARLGLDNEIDLYIKNGSYRAMRIEIESKLDSLTLSEHQNNSPIYNPNIMLYFAYASYIGVALLPVIMFFLISIQRTYYRRLNK